MSDRGHAAMLSRIAVTASPGAGTPGVAGKDALMSVLHAATQALVLRAVSGTPQSAPAYVSAHTVSYEVKFERALVVRVRGPKAATVRFTCTTPGCTFPASDQPESVSRANARAYDVKVERGVARITLTVSMLQPETVVVSARATHGPTAAEARFFLTGR